MTSKSNLAVSLSLLMTLLYACSGDDSARTEATQTAAAEAAALQAPLSPTIGKLAMTAPDHLLLDNNLRLALPAPGDTSRVTFFIVRPAESREEKTSLSNMGLARAGYLANLMGKVQLAQVFVEGNAAMQTGLFSAQENKVELNLFKSTELDPFLDMILGNFRGKRVLVVATPETLPALLNKLAGNIVESRMPQDAYDHLYLVEARRVGSVDITHLSY
ncbi:MAG: hypothetical protein RLY31_3227 [Bacteroidota bacterium]|jgi:hypothetical protein